ncbi:hypothetical protein [Salinispora arenicola]|uniref:hypothetical protein n=1 Tax=Salinispora arenicola TaxID=168697 RepID=UPI0003AA69FF|nr:hypothetical protein [Salinispora arenicola]
MSGLWRRIGRRVARALRAYGWYSALTHPMGPPMPQSARRTAAGRPGCFDERNGLGHG